MKESMWGYWIVILGISIFALMMLLQNYTTTSEQDYYLMKEVMEASMYDAVDYGYYRETGKLTMNTEKFVENFIRRFADSVNINKNYSKKTQTIKEVLLLLKNRPELKRVLYDTDCLIITLGYNDLLEKLAIQKEINPVITEIKNEYQEFIKEIRKYYKKEIIVIGYYTSPIMDYNQITHIRLLNKVLKNEQVVFIDTDSILNNYKKYFSNPKSIYPNYLGYERISSQIIRKTLEKI